MEFWAVTLRGHCILGFILEWFFMFNKERNSMLKHVTDPSPVLFLFDQPF